MADTQLKAPAKQDTARWAYGLWAVLAGLVGIILAFLIAVRKFETAADMGAVLGVVISPMATIVAAYFGVQAGSAGKAAADENAKRANDLAVNMAALVQDPEQAMGVIRDLR